MSVWHFYVQVSEDIFIIVIGVRHVDGSEQVDDDLDAAAGLNLRIALEAFRCLRGSRAL